MNQLFRIIGQKRSSLGYGIQFLVLMTFLFVGEQAISQDTLSLEKAMQKALNNNHNIKVARNNRMIAENNKNFGNAGLYPRVELRSGGDYSRQNTNQDFAGGIPDSEIEGAESLTANGSVNLSYTLFDGMGRVNEYRKFSEQAELGKVQARSTIEDVLLQVVNRYYEVARLQGQLDIAKENLTLSGKRLERVQSRYQYGKANKVEVLNARVDLDSDSSTYLQARLDLDNAKRSLNLLMGEEPHSRVIVDEEVSIDRSLEKDTLLARSLRSNARLKEAQGNVDVAELDLKIAKAGNYPDLSMSGSYSYSRLESDAGILQLNESEGLSAGLSFNYPIFRGFQQDIQEKNARIRIENREQQLKDVQKKVRRDVLNAWQDFRVRLRLLDMEERNLENARKNYERSQESYEMGRINSTQLRQAQTNLMQARIRLVNSKYQAKAAEYRLLKLAGEMNDER